MDLEITEASCEQFEEVWPIFEEVARAGETYPYPMDIGLKKAAELGFKRIQLNLAVSTNKASIKICRKNGFEIVGTLPGAFHYRGERYVDAFVMFKEL